MPNANIGKEGREGISVYDLITQNKEALMNRWKSYLEGDSLYTVPISSKYQLMASNLSPSN